VVLATSKPFQGPQGAQFVQPTRALNRYWFHELLPHLAALSTRGRLVVEEDAEEPASIIRSVSQVVDEVRQERPKLYNVKVDH
jgi:hypothetical protein